MKTDARLDRRSGFTITEIAITASIIGLLAVLALPSAMRARVRSQNSAFVVDLRQCSDAFVLYALQNSSMPADAPAGVVPAGMPDYMPRRLDWNGGTRIGGQWKWDRADSVGEQVFGICYAGVSVVQPARTSTQMAEIDAIIDNGDLDSGLFRRRPNGYIYIVQPQ